MKSRTQILGEGEHEGKHLPQCDLKLSDGPVFLTNSLTWTLQVQDLQHVNRLPFDFDLQVSKWSIHSSIAHWNRWRRGNWMLVARRSVIFRSLSFSHSPVLSLPILPKSLASSSMSHFIQWSFVQWSFVQCDHQESSCFAVFGDAWCHERWSCLAANMHAWRMYNTCTTDHCTYEPRRIIQLWNTCIHSFLAIWFQKSGLSIPTTNLGHCTSM